MKHHHHPCLVSLLVTHVPLLLSTGWAAAGHTITVDNTLRHNGPQHRASSTQHTSSHQATPPPCATPAGVVPASKLCVLGGDDAGTGAAWAAATLGISTTLVLTHRRDLGGDPTSFYHDGAQMVPSGGGLNMLLFKSGNPSGKVPFGNTLGGPGAAFLFFDTLFRTAPLNQTLMVLEDYIAAPGSGKVGADGRPVSVELVHRETLDRCILSCSYVVDGSPEGWGAAAFGLPIVFGREALENSTDPTLRFEPYAGRRSFSVGGHGAPVDAWSDPTVERTDTSSGAGSITSLCRYANDTTNIPNDAPWLLTSAPRGYDPSVYLAHPRYFVEGACCASGPDGCNPQVFRYQGLSLVTVFNNTGSTGPTLPEWYLTPVNSTSTAMHVAHSGIRTRAKDVPFSVDSAPSTNAHHSIESEHYLRRSYADPLLLWDLKRQVEIRGFQWAVNGLWHIQNYLPNGKGWGFCDSVFPSENPALSGEDRVIPGGPYRLSDFNTSSYGGDKTVAARFYRRELARLASVSPVGAAVLYDGAPRAATPNASQLGTNNGNRKWYWEPEAVVLPLYGTDYTKGVLGNTVTMPSSSSSGDGVMMGNGPSDGNMHGVHRRILFPDRTATSEQVASPLRPPVGNFTRTFMENFLSPGTPRTTFMMQSSARIGCYASNLGVASAVFVAWSERLGVNNVSMVPTMLVQYTLASELNTAITFFRPPRTETGVEFAALQIAGAYGVPPHLDAGDSNASVDASDMSTWLASYKAGILTGSIPPMTPPPGPQPGGGCLPNGSWYAWAPDWNFADTRITAKTKPSYECPQGALLKTCTAKSTTLPPTDVRCYPPGTSIALSSPPRNSSYAQLVIVHPVWNTTDGSTVDEKDATAMHEDVGLTRKAHVTVTAADAATRGQLYTFLEGIAPGTASLAMIQPSPSTSSLAISLMDLAQVVMRHAGVMREKLHGEHILQPLDLHPYSFGAA
eukprot:m.11058 g.11058  ORF g.11058 m.11058 type:complete len:961 (-) comp2813_c0_seq1:195-3077(-)